MRIEIVTQRIIEDMMIKSHLESQAIKDLADRDYVRIDEEDMDEVRRDIVSASASLANILQRYLRPDTSFLAEDAALELTPTMVYDLAFSERRQSGKAQPLADAFHSYLVNLALSKFYESVNQNDMANKRRALAAADAELIENLIYRKLPPFITR